MEQRHYESFVGFRFGAIHSSELGLKVVSSSKRYEKRLLPSPTDVSADIEGSDGQYYFGQVYKNLEISIDVAFDNIKEETWRKISQIFSTDKPQDLVFDELPFKTYKGKLKNKPDFKFVPFEDKETGERIYKGEGKITFICYYPYAFGFNKYVVRAADSYYTPKKPLPIDYDTESVYKTTEIKQRRLIENEHYNVEGNMNTPWKGGFPTKEQVKQGELYFYDPVDNSQKLIVDTRAYWENIPAWQGAAQLLVSPTLDPDGDLIFMPQYSKINCYNMDTGLNKQNGIIGSRLLVYNPGDLPVDFVLKLGNLSCEIRKTLEHYKFRISRYNVERLTIEQAVDWTGLTTLFKEDNEKYKYGDRYFKLLEPQESNKEKSTFFSIDTWDFSANLRNLKCSHPAHTYIVEPIPKEHLGYFISLFYWQSKDNYTEEELEKKMSIADRYIELYNQCISDDERYELYWNTLKILFNDIGQDFIEFVQNPPEYITPDELNYGEFEFNQDAPLSYYTLDYLEINNNGFDEIKGGEVARTVGTQNFERRSYVRPLYLDTEKRALYYKKESTDRYKIGNTKVYLNDNIEKGRWFQIPPGWSLIDISPVIDENIWNGKLWLDARPFDWGNTIESYQSWYDKIYREAAIDYISENITSLGIQVGNSYDNATILETDTPSQIKSKLKQFDLPVIENYLQFARWYDYDNAFGANDYDKTLNKKRAERAEIGFLKLLAAYWRVNILKNGKAVGDIDNWWWYANNYIWENFPPIYWGYADLLNHAEIDYTPLFY